MSLDLDLKIKNVTRKINTGLNRLPNRISATKAIITLMNEEFGECAG